MLTAQRTRTWILIAALALFGALTPVAGAGQWRGDHRPHDRVHQISHETHQKAGTLVIDGRRFTLRPHRSVIRQARRAFRRCGYSTRIHRGRLIVYDRSGCGPRVRWSSGRYGAELSRSRGKLVMCFYKIHDRRHRWRDGRHGGRPHWRWPHARGHRRGWICD